MPSSCVPFFKVDTLAELETADRQTIVLVLENETVCYFDTVTEEWKAIVVANQQAYPVGSIFLSVVSTDPATLLGYGTWSAIGAGKMLVGFDSGDADFDTLEETGGAKTVALTEGQMPSHTHVQNSHNHTQDAHTHTQNAHTHVQDAHSHVITSQTATTGGATSYEHGALDTSSAETEATETTNPTTATNQNATAVNQNATATNQAATATNQNTGGGQAHDNLPPYFTISIWKRVS